jgi:hypothetical protein
MLMRSVSRNHIDVEIKEGDNVEWTFTGVYGEAKAEQKHRTWTLLHDLHAQQTDDSMAWLCAGDYNEILYQHEKEGVKRAQACLDPFKNAIEVCGLYDLGFIGDVFTWRNN